MNFETSTIIIRPFEPKEQEATKELILAGLVEHWGHLDPTKNPDLDDIAASYAEGIFLLAWRGKELVGTGALIPEEQGIGRIVRMSVDIQVRRQGVGTQILHQLILGARNAGYKQIVLETTSTWEPALSFYKYHGFQEVAVRDGDTHFIFHL